MQSKWHQFLAIGSTMLIAVLALAGAVAHAEDIEAGTQPACGPAVLDILLTNDDGYDTPGIEALHAAFAAAGHRVKRIAPNENYSGSSAALSLRPVSVARVPSERFPGQVYAVDGTPATTVLLGATALFGEGRPDLVISGINEGANLGPAATISGTVGAIVAGSQVLYPPVPGIALSTNLIGEEVRSPENLALNERVAEFAVRLVAELQKAHCGTHVVMPPTRALNVNYPPLAQDEIRGVRWARQSPTRSFGLEFVAAGGDVYVPKPSRPDSNNEISEGDTERFNQGYVTIVPLDGDYSISIEGMPSLESLVP